MVEKSTPPPKKKNSKENLNEKSEIISLLKF